MYWYFLNKKATRKPQRKPYKGQPHLMREENNKNTQIAQELNINDQIQRTLFQ